MFRGGSTLFYPSKAFSLREHAPPTPTLLFGPQGVRCAEAKKTVPPRRVYRFSGTSFPVCVRIFFKRSQSNHTIIGIFSLQYGPYSAVQKNFPSDSAQKNLTPSLLFVHSSNFFKKNNVFLEFQWAVMLSLMKQQKTSRLFF